MVKKPTIFICALLLFITALTMPTKINSDPISDKTFFGSLMMVTGVAFWAWALKKSVNQSILDQSPIIKHVCRKQVSYVEGFFDEWGLLPSRKPGYVEYITYEPVVVQPTYKFPNITTARKCSLASCIGTHLVMFGTYLLKE